MDHGRCDQVVGKRLTSEQLAASVVDALVDTELIDRADLPKPIAIAAEEIDVRKALGDY